MSLIEQLGGYEKAKKHQIEREPNGLLHDYDFELVDALLEYRRANNIYEEGDKVVLISKRRKPKLWTWAHVTNWRPEHSLLDCGENSLYPFANVDFRHATDLEIATGHRLP